MQAYQSKPINENYSIVQSQLLGKGSTGNVYLGFERSNPNGRVAIKAIDLRSIDNEVTRYLLSCQIAALSNLGKVNNTGHENIVKLHDVVLQDHFIYLVMEHLEGGTLAQYLKKHPHGLHETQALCIFRQILEGYVHMRHKQIVHRDLKPDNVLFKTDPDKSKAVAIIDFGYCEMEEVPNKPQLFYNVGSPKYMSPEAYKENYYSQKSDIWALGVMFYEMLAGRTCDQGMSMQNYLEMIEKQGIPLPHHFNIFNRHLLCLMLNNSHNNRMNAEQILREIDTYQNSLSHQRSEVLLRGSLEELEPRTSQDLLNMRMNKNSLVFQSLILPPSENSFRRTTNWNDITFTVKPVSRPPLIKINSKPVQFRENHHEMVPQEYLKTIENVEFNSARDIIHRKPITIPKNDPFHTTQSLISNNFTNPFNPPNQIRKIDQNLQNMSHSFNGFMNPVNPNGLLEQKPQIPHGNPLVSINNQPNKIQFVHNYTNLAPPPQFQRNELQNIGTHSHGIKIRINSPSSPSTNTPPHIQHIQHQNKIEIEQPIEKGRRYSPQRQSITMASTVQFFTEKKTSGQQEAFSHPQPQLRQIINLRPPYGNGEIKVGFTKLQPQRIIKNNPYPSPTPMIKQGFCV